MKAYRDIGNGTIELNSGQIIANVHSAKDCKGEVCPLHKPSNHNMLDLPLVYDFDSQSFLRKCGKELEYFIVDPDDYNYNQGYEVIVRNSAKCLNCNKHLVSTHRHDFVTCECGSLSVDGGHSYVRRLFNKKENYEETSILFKK